MQVCPILVRFLAQLKNKHKKKKKHIKKLFLGSPPLFHQRIRFINSNQRTNPALFSLFMFFFFPLFLFADDGDEIKLSY